MNFLLEKRLVLFLILGTIPQTSGDNPTHYGEDLFLTLFGLDSMPECENCYGLPQAPSSVCELCDGWNQVQEKQEQSVTQQISEVLEENLKIIAVDFELPRLPTPDQHSYGFIVLTFAILILLYCIKRRRLFRKKRGFQIFPFSQKAGNPSGQCSRSQTSLKDDAILRKTKKSKKPLISKQGLMILKKTRHSTGDGGILDVITHESCKFVTYKNRKANGFQVFDMKRQPLPDSIMNALLCIQPNCTQHPHRSIRKCGAKIICDPEAFGLEHHVEQPSNKRELNHYQAVENIQHEEIEEDRGENEDEKTLEEEGYDLGPPRASSSFISDTSSMSLTFELNNDGDSIDPFSCLDETESPNISQIKAFFDNSVSWFGGLYSTRLDNSFSSFRMDTSLDETISKSLSEFEKSLNTNEVKRNMSFYGMEGHTESVFQLALVYLARQIIGQTKKSWDSLRGSRRGESVWSSIREDSNNNNRPNKDLQCFGYAVYDNSDSDF